MYRYDSGNVPAHMPSGNIGNGNIQIITTGANLQCTTQIIYESNGTTGQPGAVWSRASTGSLVDVPWQRLDNFGCNTLSALAEKIGISVDYGNAKTDYGLTQWEGFMATVLSLKNNNITHAQIALHASTGKFAIRETDGTTSIELCAWTYFGS